MTALRILAGVAVYVLALLACAFLVLSGLGALRDEDQRHSPVAEEVRP